MSAAVVAMPAMALGIVVVIVAAVVTLAILAMRYRYELAARCNVLWFFRAEIDLRPTPSSSSRDRSGPAEPDE